MHRGSGTVVNNETVKNRIIESENVFSQLSRKHACFHLSILTQSKLRVANRKQLINVRQTTTTPTEYGHKNSLIRTLVTW